MSKHVGDFLRFCGLVTISQLYVLKAGTYFNRNIIRKDQLMRFNPYLLPTLHAALCNQIEFKFQGSPKEKIILNIRPKGQFIYKIAISLVSHVCISFV